MSVYTVHEPPPRAADSWADPQGFLFVRDGFYLWAFLLTPLWMIWHRLWLVLAIYLVVTLGLETALRLLGGSPSVVALGGIVISLLVGLEAGSLRRMTLGRRHWTNVGIVSGDRLEDAELRFFASWVRGGAAPNGAPHATSSAPSSTAADASDVIGLFPEPGAQR